jgi:AAA+ ATPase superfamily predicted ATPase
MINPFSVKVISPDGPFCDRISELKELSSYAKSAANVVIYSPRRYGKTSLVQRVQADVKKAGVLAVYIDFFGLSSIDDIAKRVARGVYEMLQKKETLFKKTITLFKSPLCQDSCHL